MVVVGLRNVPKSGANTTVCVLCVCVCACVLTDSSHQYLANVETDG